MEKQYIDEGVVIVGAGISGINAAYRLQSQCPSKSYTIIESRNDLGGTWNFFKYPGIRSDSDLHTFGFPWSPWKSDKTVADAESILAYLKQCAADHGIDAKIQYGHKLVEANWSSESHTWRLSLSTAKGTIEMTCRWVIFASGYYDYQEALPVRVPGIEQFEGEVIHPQFWPSELNYTAKNIVIIGSGATAVTLLPNLTEKANHVTMLQRSPTYIVSRPEYDGLATWLKWIFPSSVAFKIIRMRSLILPALFFKFCRSFPQAARRIIQNATKAQLPHDIPIDPHFSPTYNPWEQRLCACISGDFYKALSSGKASIVTDRISMVTHDSIILQDSKERLKPDIIITATGLKLQILGGAKLRVNGEMLPINKKHLWKGALIENVPNAAVLVGYTNASWTLGSDSSSQLITRIINHMEADGYTSVVPIVGCDLEDKPLLNLKSTYIFEANGELPKAGDKGVWKARDDYLFDVWSAWYGDIKEDLYYSSIS